MNAPSSSKAPGSHKRPSEIDYDGFARDVTALRREIFGRLSGADLTHMKRLERWGRLCSLLGYASAWMFPNPLSALLMSQGNFTRWMLMHHIGHRGYDKVPGVPARYTSEVFAMGWRRYVDWFDWIVPEAWNYEHNVLHHYHTGEQSDPDLLERNVEFIRRLKAPLWVRYLIVFALALTWKVYYYAPSTLLQLQRDRQRRERRKPKRAASLYSLFNPFAQGGAEFWRRCLLPYATVRFAIIPALFLPLAWYTSLGYWPALFVLVNSLGAEALTNLHAFAVIGPNHTGDDLYRFDMQSKTKSEFFARQVLGSVNYQGGSDGVDFAQAWLNYQIEHHLWPDIPMSQYQKIHERTKALCAEYGIPYHQAPVWHRAKKMVDVMVGKTSMLRIDALSIRAGERSKPEQPQLEASDAYL